MGRAAPTAVVGRGPTAQPWRGPWAGRLPLALLLALLLLLTTVRGPSRQRGDRCLNMEGGKEPTPLFQLQRTRG